KNTLPEYMFPSAFVFVESLPLSANGKLERRALPLPPLGADRTAAEFHTATETAIAKIWQSLLAVENIQPDDNFFALGGNSLLAAQMISRLCRHLRTEIPIRLAFESPTLRDLASAAAK